MKKLLLFCLIFLLSFAKMANAEIIQVGTGSSQDYALPVNMYFNYSFTQQIYTAAEIGRSGYITDISFYYSYSNAFNMEGLKVYMFHTSKNAFTSNNDIIEVYEPNYLFFEGTFSASGSGWVTITLDRPFKYNGSSNLVVCLYDPTNGFAGNNYKFRYTATEGNKAISYYSDNSCPDITDLSSFSGTKKVYSYRSNIQFNFYDQEVQPYESIVQIGYESEQSYHLPVNMYYNYSMTQQIYHANQIGGRGTIFTIGFDYAYSGSFSMEGVKVYMKNVRKQEFNDVDDYVEVAESDKVFEGTFLATGPGWVTLTLDTPFEYDGTSNLLVCFLDQTQDYPGSSYKFNCSTAYSSSLVYYSDSSIPYLSNLSGYSGSKQVLDIRANIRLGFTPGVSVQIGNSTSTSHTWALPTNTYYNYSLTQQIFKAAEIGTEGVIHSLSFHYAYNQPLLMGGIKVYMKHVNKSSFSSNTDVVPVSDDDLVYEGLFSCPDAGWSTITLDTPFDYDGTSNLLVCFYDPVWGFLGSDYYFCYTNTSEPTSLLYYSDTSVPNLTNLSSYSGTKERVSYRADIRIGITPTVTIGTGTMSDYHVPFNSFSYYSFVEQLYSADEIGTDGLINSISFNMNSDTPLTTSVTVYMKHVSRNRFASNRDYEPVSPTDIVFEGNWTLNHGWTTIYLDKPFEYDGTSNLLIAVDENDPSYSTRYFYYTEKTGATLCCASNITNPDPYNLPSLYVYNDCYDFHANLRLDIIPFGEDYCLKPNNITLATQPNSIVMDWDTEGDTWLLFWKAATETTPASQQWGVWATPPFTITQYLPYGGSWTDLEPGATYGYRMAARCADGEDSQWSSLAYVTLPVEQSFPIDFETGYLNQFPFNNNVSAYPWVVTNTDAANGTYCMMSSNQGEHNSTSAIEATYYFEDDGYVSFDAKCMGEGSSYDVCKFFIDGEAQFSYGAHGDTWDLYEYEVEAGTHTFRWEYSKDYSVNPNGDTFFVDNISFTSGLPINEAPVEADFETGDFSQLIFDNNVSSYPWVLTSYDAASGAYSMCSSNYEVHSSTSAIESTCHFQEDGFVYFEAKCLGEGRGTIYDACTFYIDGEAQFTYGAHGNTWDPYWFEVTAGTHTFRWEYTKDDSTNPEGDTFRVDNLVFGLGEPCILPTYSKVTEKTLSSATVKWNGCASTFKLRYKLTGGSWTTVSNITDNTYTITGLTPGSYQAQVWATCDESHKVSVDFTITELLSTAQWYSYLISGGTSDSGKYIKFRMNNPYFNVASDRINPPIYASTYANSYVWAINSNGDLLRAPIDLANETIGEMETLVTEFCPYTQDMAYNPVDGKIYLKTGSANNLRCFDPDDYTVITEIGHFNMGLTLAINREGAAYSIGWDGNLYSIDLTDASATLIGSTGKDIGYIQSLAFDLETDELFWPQISYYGDDGIYKVDTETAAVTFLGKFLYSQCQLTCLFMTPTPVEQTIALENGWTWFSSYLEYQDNTLNSIKDQIEASSVTSALIKSQNKYVQYTNNLWFGNLTSLNNEVMYMINLDHTLDISLNGVEVNPENYPISLSGGWNWIGFLSPTSMSISNAFSGFSPHLGDVVKSQNGFATYMGSAWTGSLKNLAPGKGYMYQNNSSSNITFTYPSSGKGAVPEESTERYWKNDVRAFAHNLCMMVSVEGLALSEGSHEIGAFVDGECRGSARIQTVEGFDTPMAFLTVSGEEGETVCFKVLDVLSGMEMGSAVEHIPFTNDALYGQLNQPYLLHLNANGVDSHNDEVSLFPNPTKDKVRLQASDIQIVKLFNAMGQCLYSKEFDHATEVELDLSAFSAGVYTLSVRTHEDKISNLRVVRQ